MNEKALGEIIVYQSDDGLTRVDVRFEGDTVWLTQQQMADLFQTSRTNVVEHIRHIYEEGELSEDATCRDFRQVREEGGRRVVRQIPHYNLDMIISLGYRVKSAIATRFRRWATERLKEYIVKGFTMDDERLKNPDGRPDYFDELLERIREIRASEKRFYQKVRDLLSLSSDYDKTDKATQMFFAETQNKLLYAVTGQTAAEIIVGRADASKPNMALTAWKGSIVRKGDIYTAKNYLQQDEIDTLNRLTTMFLDSAELRVKERKDLTLRYWRETVDSLLNFQGKLVLQGAGSVSNKQMEEHVDAIYEEFNARRKALAIAEAEQTDAELLALEEAVEEREK